MDKYGRKHTDGSRSGGQPVDIRAKALALLNEVWKERGYPPEDEVRREDIPAHEALCRAVEQHEATKQERDNLATALKVTAAACADHVNTILQLRSELADFKQEVSDGCAWILEHSNMKNIREHLSRFIIPKPKPDPLERLLSVTSSLVDKETLRDRLEAEGLEIREKGQ